MNDLLIVEYFKAHKAERYTMDEWTELLRTDDILITSNASEIPKDRILTAQQMQNIIAEECIWKNFPFEEPTNADTKSGGNPAYDALNAMPLAEAVAKLGRDPATFIDTKPAPTPVPDPLTVAYEKKYPDGSSLTLSVPQPKPKSKMIPLDQWRRDFRRNFDLVASQPPINALISTEDGSPIRIDFFFKQGKPPQFETFIYVCRTVGREVEWVAQRERDRDLSGWGIVLLPWSRDRAMNDFDLSLDCGYIQEIRIVRVASWGRVLLAEVTKW